MDRYTTFDINSRLIVGLSIFAIGGTYLLLIAIHGFNKLPRGTPRGITREVLTGSLSGACHTSSLDF